MLAVAFSFPVHQHGLHAYWTVRTAQIIVIERSVTYRRSFFSILVLVCLQITVREKIALIPVCKHKASYIKTTNWYSFIISEFIGKKAIFGEICKFIFKNL